MTASLQPASSLAPGDPFAGPSRRGRWVALAVAGALLAGGVAWVRSDDPADRLTDWALVGARGPACVRLVLGNDVSGSMTEFAAARENAVDTFLRWAPGNLRSDDELGVLDFAAEARWAREPATIERGTGGRASAGAVDGLDTLLQPVLDRVAELSPSDCDTVLLLVSDAQLADLPGSAEEGRAALRAAGVHDVVLLVPGEDIDVPPVWTTAHPEAEPLRFAGEDADAAALVLGQVVAGLTGQTLEER